MTTWTRWLLMLALLLAATSVQAGTKHYYYTDAQGTVLAKADAQGNIVASYDYTPYGVQVLGTPPSGPTGYTGHVNDAESGFVYMQQRYYDPVVGRFLSVDPITPATGELFAFGRYSYANNNPYKFVDPDGRCPICAVIAVRFVVGASIDIATQHFVGGKTWGDVDLGDAAVAGIVSTAIPGLGNLTKTGYQGAKAAIPAAKAIAKVTAKSANTANRAAKNAATIARNIDKIEGAAADVGKATVTAGVHQVVKAEIQSKTPEVTASDAHDAVKRPPPPRDDHLE